MIPDLPEIVAAHEWLTRRYGLSGHRDDGVLAAARDEADALADSEADEPAALFFAFARRGHTLRDAWAPLTDLLVLTAVQRLGRQLAASGDELRRLRVSVAARRVSWDDVRVWFASRMAP